jgi:FkbM family methyltransferase
VAILEELKQTLIRTPLERPMQQLRHLGEYRRLWRHPELSAVYAEQGRVEAALARVLAPESNCLDVGCHLGSFLSLMLRRSPRGRHMAFEALPEKARRLRKRFPEVEVVEAAVGEAAGEVDFFRNRSRSGFSGTRMGDGSGDVLERIRVRAARLDDLVPPSLRVDFVKVDVEGVELAVLKGAKQLILRNRPVVLFECTRANLSRAKTSAREVFDFINDALCMRVYRPGDWGAGSALTFDGFYRAMTYPFEAFNFFAAPAERRG